MAPKKQNTGPGSSPQAYYRHQVETGRLSYDEGQADAVNFLDELFHDLAQAQTTLKKARWQRLFIKVRPDGPAELRGLYLYGGVGRGKTMLMDMFASCLEEE